MPKMLAAGFIPDSIRWIARALAVSGLASGICACSQLGPSCDTSDDSNPAEEYRGGTVEGRDYMSSPWTGPLLWFPGGQRYDMIHNLGCTPHIVGCFESFSEEGTAKGSIALAAGNMCIIQTIDSHKIRIKNDSCSDYFVLVTAEAPVCGDAGVDAAGGSDAAQDVAAE
jgi:hypothetical protein